MRNRKASLNKGGSSGGGEGFLESAIEQAHKDMIVGGVEGTTVSVFCWRKVVTTIDYESCKHSTSLKISVNRVGSKTRSLTESSFKPRFR